MPAPRRKAGGPGKRKNGLARDPGRRYRPPPLINNGRQQRASSWEHARFREQRNATRSDPRRPATGTEAWQE